MALRYRCPLLGSFLLGILVGTAQQTPDFSTYHFNPMLVNPAYSGVLPSTEIALTNDGPAAGFEGEARLFTLTGNIPFSNPHVGMGAGYIADRIGVTKLDQAFVSYGYKLIFEDDVPYWKVYNPSILSFGIKAGVMTYREDLLEMGLPSDPEFSGNIHTTLPSFSIGMLFNRGPIFAGVSMDNLFYDVLGNRSGLKIENPVYGYVGYRFYTDLMHDVMIVPSVLAKYVGETPFQIDFNATVTYRNKLELGAGHRTNSGFNAMAGVYLAESFRLGYQYIGGVKGNALGSRHGLFLGYRFGRGYQSR